MFIISGDVTLRIQDLKPGNEITETMHSGLLVIGDTATPFILQRRVRGSFDNLSVKQPTRITLSCFKQRRTIFARHGYVSIMIGYPNAAMCTYLKKEDLRDFYASFCAHSISGLI